MKEWFFETLKKTELYNRFLRNYGNSYDLESCLTNNWNDEGWYFTKNSIQYRKEDLFDNHEDGYNWRFADDGFEWTLKQVLLSHGFEVDYEGGDGEDGLFIMRKVKLSPVESA